VRPIVSAKRRGPSAVQRRAWANITKRSMAGDWEYHAQSCSYWGERGLSSLCVVPPRLAEGRGEGECTIPVKLIAQAILQTHER
jgi:hypothetical protein